MKRKFRNFFFPSVSRRPSENRFFGLTALFLCLTAGLLACSPEKSSPEMESTDSHNHGAPAETAGQTGSAADGSSAASSDLALYLEEQTAIMDEMMASMTVEPTKNAALDYLRGMIPHHEAAVEMAHSYLDYGGENSELRAMAEEMIRQQSQEIEEMEAMAQELAASGETDEEKEQAYLDAYEELMASHDHAGHAATSALDVEQAFAEGMIEHHRMAVEMSQAIVDCLDSGAVRELAQTIIDTQEREIRQMEEILNRQTGKFHPQLPSPAAVRG